MENHQNKMKIAVSTTFPESYWDICAAEMFVGFNEFWPEECKLFIGLDALPDDRYKELYDKIYAASHNAREFFIGNEFSQEQIDFIKRNKESDNNKDYKLQVVRFSYKIFSLWRTMQHVKALGYDYLIWLDADVITKRSINIDDLKKCLPDEGQDISFLGREGAPHSECGFIAYRVNDVTNQFITDMVAMYIDDSVLTLKGWTDCHIFDHLRKDLSCKNLSHGIPGYHVWPLSPLGQFMDHRKGPRKINGGDKIMKKQKTHVALPSNAQQGYTLQNMEIKTRNCVEHAVILDQIKQNLMKITNFAKICKKNDEEVVIASAGDSLNRSDIMPFVERGIKIVAVKHAIERLKSWGIKPWACVLLDPRPHVEAFVKKPDRDVIYFVASMVHPSVVDALLENKCRVIGYHALVGADEGKVLRPDDFVVSGGSATATRSICLLSEVLGFQKFHLFGYDLSHPAKPDMSVKSEDGAPKNYEIQIDAHTWGNQMVKKTFWTEGQFLAQAKELETLYKDDKLDITIYGDGIAGWNFKHWKQYMQWAKEYTAGLNKRREKSFNVNDWLSSL